MEVSEMPTSLCDSGLLGPCYSLSEYAEEMFLESTISHNIPTLLIRNSASESPSHPSSEDSLYPLENTHALENTPFASEEIWKKFDLPVTETSTQWSCSLLDEMSWISQIGFPCDPPASGKGQISTTGKELRNHDCMWAGQCTNKEHVRNQAKNPNNERSRVVVAPGQTLLKNPVQPKDNSTVSVVPSSVMMAPSPMLTASPTVLRVPKNGVVARTPQGKSLLLRAPSRPGEPAARVVTVRLPSEDKDAGSAKGSIKPAGSTASSPRSFVSAAASPRPFVSAAASPRPETPLSLSEEEDEDGASSRCDVWGRGGGGLVLGAPVTGPRGSTPEDLEEAEAAAALAEAIALAAAEEDEECGEAVSMTEVTGQVPRVPSLSSSSSESSSSTSSASSSVTDNKSNACYLDHDYHKTNSSMKSVKTDHLGVQTPSDSEEEIDVVSLTGGEKPVPSVRSSPAPTASRSSKASAGSGRVNLPTNPSARDKQQLQLTVEAAMARVSANVAAEPFSDGEDGESDDDEEESEEAEEEEEEEEDEEEYEEYDSSEGQRRLHGHHYSSSSNSRSSHHHGGKISAGSKRHASDDLRGPSSAKQSRTDRRHKRWRRNRDQDPDYDEQPSSSSGHGSWSSYSNSNSYLSSSSSSTASPPRRRGGHRRRHNRQSHEGGDSAPEDPLERRSMHNTMERQRRIDLRNAFENLRLLVPAVSEKERAAKVTILREAAGFCTHLTSLGGKQQDSIKALRARQVALRAQVSSLRRSLAAAR